MELGTPAARAAGRARTKPERLTDLVDAGKSYAPAERRPGDGSSRYAGVSRTVDAVTFRESWCAQHDGRDCGSFDNVKVAARAYDFARHCQGKPAVNFDGSGEGGETFCAYCEDWELRAVADRDEKPLIEKYGRRFFEDPDHPGEVYVVQTGVQWSGVAPSVTVDAVGQDVEEGAITYLLNDELRKMIAATPQGLVIQRSANADPAPQSKLSELSELRESPPPKTPSRKRPRPDDDAMATENARLQKELDDLRAATQRLERDLRACEARADRSEARADRYGRQRDDARGDVDDLRRDVKRLRRERNEARQDATSSERALAAMRHKFDRQVAAQRDEATPARPGKPKKSAARRAAKSAAKPAATVVGDALAALPPAATAASPVPPPEHPPYPVDALVEAQWRGGSKFYPAIVLAVGNNGETQTVDIEYCDDSDRELGLPVEYVRPANRRLLQRYFELTGKRTPPSVMLPPPPPTPPLRRFAKGNKVVAPWDNGQRFAATVVWVRQYSARVVFEDGAEKTVPLDELEPLRTPVHPSAMSATTVTSQQSATGDIRCTSGRPDCYCQAPRSRAIVRYNPSTGEDLEEFCSVGAAADKLDISGSSISDNLSGKTKSTAAGHVFRYKAPPPPRKKKKIPEALPVEAPPPPPPPPLPTEPCAICMSVITEDACVLGCGHAYHARCLGDLADHVRLAAPTRRSLGVSCPLCRKVTRAGVGAEEAS